MPRGRQAFEGHKINALNQAERLLLGSDEGITATQTYFSVSSLHNEFKPVRWWRRKSPINQYVRKPILGQVQSFFQLFSRPHVKHQLPGQMTTGLFITEGSNGQKQAMKMTVQSAIKLNLRSKNSTLASYMEGRKMACTLLTGIAELSHISGGKKGHLYLRR